MDFDHRGNTCDPRSVPMEEGGPGSPYSDENAILEQAQILKTNGSLEQLQQLIEESRSFAATLSKVKASKLMKKLVDIYLELDSTSDAAFQICKDCVAWAASQNRIFLKKSLEVRLMQLCYETGRYREALNVGESLVLQLKKFNDKDLILLVYLLQSKCYYSLTNYDRARVCLISARATANSVYVSPLVQAELELQAGVLHAAQHQDYNTAFSYFAEAFKLFDEEADLRAWKAIKYMVLCKIMQHKPEQISKVLSETVSLTYSGVEITGLVRIGECVKEESLPRFNQTLNTFFKELEEDPFISLHLRSLEDTVLERNIMKIILPYSRVNVDYLAHKIGIQQREVERKLSMMILDRKIRGVLDQEVGCLELETRVEDTSLLDLSVSTIHTLEGVLDRFDTILNKIK